MGHFVYGTHRTVTPAEFLAHPEIQQQREILALENCEGICGPKACISLKKLEGALYDETSEPFLPSRHSQKDGYNKPKF